MGEEVLVAPLGLSPGAVSGLAMALRDGDNGRLGNFEISRVITLGTTHPDVVGASQLLATLFYEEDIAYEAHFITHDELRIAAEEGWNLPGEERPKDKATDAFMIKMGQILERLAQEDVGKIHVGVTSGRSGMGALAALATNVYGADHLWHFWVSQDIEDSGRLRDLPQPLRLDNNKYLNPALSAGEYEVVPLPFLDLRPYHPIIKQYYRHYRSALDEGQRMIVPDEIAPAMAMLVNLGVKKLEDIFPAMLTIHDADRIVIMTRIYPTLSDPQEQEEIIKELVRMLGKYGHLERSTEDRLELLVKTGARPEEVMKALERDADKNGLWKNVLQNKDALTLGMSAGSFLLSIVTLTLQLNGLI